MFTPPFCPRNSCSAHRDPTPGFYKRSGFYRARCRAHRIQRYCCKVCSKMFSRQTFRADCWDKRPHLNVPLVQYMSSGVGLRETSRRLGLTLRCTELKFRKIARHLRQLNLNLQGNLPERACLHFDELETYEGQRNARPLTVPILIESDTRFIVWAESATIRPRGTMTDKRKRSIEASERRYGVRVDASRHAILRTMKRGAALLTCSQALEFRTDQKINYAKLAREAFAGLAIQHRTTNSKLARTVWNPLFPINHEEARLRDLMARMRKESWLVSKKRRYLDLGLQLHMAVRNLIRNRYNTDDQTPAQMLGFVSRRLSFQELLGWRQSWGKRSVHPLGRSGIQVCDVTVGAAAPG